MIRHLHFSKRNAVQSALLYAAGDTIASLMLHNFSIQRMAGIAIIGGSLYSLEIPNYFRWIHSKTESLHHLPAAIQRTIYALIYFNPLWIARHLALVQIVAGNVQLVSWNLIGVGYRSFVMNLPLTIVINFLIQNNIPLRRRFLASSLFSGVMAIYYAMSHLWFQ